MRIPWKRLARAAVLLLALGFLAVLVWRQWAVLKTYQWHLAPGWLLLGLAGLELTWLFEAATWNAILRGLGGQLRLHRAARAAWFLSNLIRYIPGNIWQYLGMVELAAEDGVPRPVTLASLAVHQAICIATGLALTALYFAVAGQSAWLTSLRPLLLLAPVCLLCLQPRLLQWGLNWALGILGRPPVQITLTWRGIWVLVLRYGLVWLAEGLSFAALVRGLVPLGWPAAPHLVAAWAAAYIAGFLSLLTPSGLGVREAAMTFLLGPLMPASVAVVVAMAARLLMILAEVLGAGAVVLWDRSRARLLPAPHEPSGTGRGSQASVARPALGALDDRHQPLDEGQVLNEPS